MHVDLIESIAWWRIGLTDGRRAVADAATDALVHGSESAAVAELAGIRDDENPFVVDALVARVVADLGLESAMSEDPELPAARRLCRATLTGETSERELTRWIHSYFHHESTSDLVNQLADLDDEFDLAEDGVQGTTADVRARVRAVATLIVDGA
ncbi:hypothetical protein DY023_07365 [Microbacterium bovistercoris]|uniref:Uncharacterized protein n=1 Tax=Microbacterium bovistercoris TaxID=2293570 RepID=A0A371NUX5_9MICO|nr:hypothetical protein [Microbacterium bovistercoris]REJ06100.1 hypothetical protein DY023_07365 [Microbacterium bovistercoris]